MADPALIDPALSDPAEHAAVALTVETWRDHGARLLPGAAQGPAELAGPFSVTVPRLYRSGRRCVRLAAPVRLCADAAARDADALVLVRELTGIGAAVSWTASCADGCAADRRYAHLFPPAAIEGAHPAVARDWRERYLPCMCLYRRGPGFVEIRDRRRGTLEILTLDDPPTLVAIGPLLDGVPATRLPAAVRGTLREADLIAEQGGLAWWLPTRVHRWPNPSMIV